MAIKLPQLTEKILEAAREQCARDRFVMKRNVFRMSGVGDCQNKLVMDWERRDEKGADDDFSKRAALGVGWHEVLEKWVSKKFDVLLSECLLQFRYGGIKYMGHPDVVIGHGREAVVVDFKFLNEYAFAENKKKLRREYEWQAQLYMHAVGKQGFVDEHPQLAGKAVRYAIVFLLCPQNADMHEVLVPYSSRTVRKIVKHVETAYACRKKGVRGKQEYWKDAYPCTYCPHREPCWKLEGKLKEVNTTVSSQSPDGRIIASALRRKEAADQQQKEAARDFHRAATELLTKSGTSKVTIPGRLQLVRWRTGRIVTRKL